MIWNPLDWSGRIFLIFYGILMVISFLICVYFRSQIGSNKLFNYKLSVFELAYLTGGEERAKEAILLSVLSSNAAKLSNDGKAILMNRGTSLPFDVLQIADRFSGINLTRKSFYIQFDLGLERVKRSLVQKGLVPSDEQMSDHYTKVALVTFAPLLLAGLKIYVGIERHMPVQILVILFIISIIGILALCASPYTTRNGRLALQHHQVTNYRAARAPLGNEIVIAFALAGSVVLQGTAFANVVPKSDNSDGGGGSGGGSGDGCGGGCGGCGG
jgi:uncharacterized protein (TIGR04222 family)